MLQKCFKNATYLALLGKPLGDTYIHFLESYIHCQHFHRRQCASTLNH